MSYFDVLKTGKIPAKTPKSAKNNAYDDFVAKKKTEAKDATSKVIVISPKKLSEIEQLIDQLKKKQGIIVDFSRSPAELGQRMLDFLSGAVYALDGKISRLEGAMYLMTSSGVDITKNF